MTNDIKDWSTTPASNDTADPGINWQEGMAPSAVNNSSRAMMASVKKWWDESLGGIAAYSADTGATDAHVLTPAPAITAYAAGQTFSFFASATNTGAATVDVSALGVKAIEFQGTVLTAGQIAINDLVTLVYDGTAFQMMTAQGALPSLTITGALTAGAITTSGSLVFSGVDNPTIRGGDADGVLRLAAGASQNLGANFTLYAESHATLAGDVLLRSGTTTTLQYDLSATLWDFKANDVKTSGTVNGGTIEVSSNTALPIDQLSAITGAVLNHTTDKMIVWDDSASVHKAIAMADFCPRMFEVGATSFTLSDTYANGSVNYTGASVATATIPLNSATDHPIGTIVQLYQEGAGQVTVSPAGGVTLRSPNGAKTSQQYAVIAIMKTATDEWVCYGDVTT